MAIASAPRVALGRDPLTESRINADRLLRVLERLGQRYELGVRERTIVVPARVVRVALDALGVALHGAGKIAFLEQSVAFLARHSRQRRVNVRSAVRGGLCALCLLELIQDVRRAVFGEGLFKEADCGFQVVLLGIGRADAPVCFCDERIIRTELGNTPMSKHRHEPERKVEHTSRPSSTAFWHISIVLS